MDATVALNPRLKKSRAQEAKTALLHGGQRNGGSGSGWSRKGDVRTKFTLIEAKRTDARQITLKATDLEKIWAEAWAEGRIPVLGFELAGRRYVVLNEDDYLEEHGGSTGATAVARVGEVSRGRAGTLLPEEGRSVVRRGKGSKGRLQRRGRQAGMPGQA
jgi:hypothetical protein